MNEPITMRDMTNLFLEISGVIAEQEGEITPDVEKKLEILFEKAATKADSAHFIIEKFKSDVEFYKAKAKQYQAVAKKAERVVDRVKEKLIDMMTAAEVNEIQGSSVKVKMSNTEGEIVIDDESKLPPSCVQVKIEPNKSAIRVALMKETVPGAHLKINKSIRFTLVR